MKESDLYPPVRDWLLERGYEVHVEMFGCDIVAIKDGLLTAIELKLGMRKRLTEQLYEAAMWADFVIGAIPGVRGKSPNLSCWKYNGYGCLLIDTQESKVHQALKPQRQPLAFHKRRNYRIKKLTGRAPAMEHELAGLPSCAQLREQRLKREAN